MTDHVFEAELWEWGGKGSWHFITVPADISGIIRMGLNRRAGFGSVRVLTEIAGTRWKTSLFPDAKSACYLLPVKADIRRKARINLGDVLLIGLSVIG